MKVNVIDLRENMVSTHDDLGAKMVNSEPKSLALALFEI